MKLKFICLITINIVLANSSFLFTSNNNQAIQLNGPKQVTPDAHIRYVATLLDKLNDQNTNNNLIADLIENLSIFAKKEEIRLNNQIQIMTQKSIECAISKKTFDLNDIYEHCKKHDPTFSDVDINDYLRIHNSPYLPDIIRQSYQQALNSSNNKNTEN